MGERRVGGILFIKVNGDLLQAKGEFTTNINPTKREGVVGQDGTHGYKEEPKIQFIEGTITDSSELDLEALYNTKDATVTAELANGKVHQLREAWFAGDGDYSTGEGEIAVRFEGMSGREIR